MRSIYGATTSVRIYDAEFRNQNKGFLGTNGVCGKFRDQKWRFSGTDEVRQVGNAAGRGKTGSYGSAGCGELSARVLLAGGLSPATRFLGSLRSLGMTIRGLGAE